MFGKALCIGLIVAAVSCLTGCDPSSSTASPTPASAAEEISASQAIQSFQPIETGQPHYSGPLNIAQENEGLAFSVKYARTEGKVHGKKFPEVTLIQSKNELDAYYTADQDVHSTGRKNKISSDSTIGFTEAIAKYKDAFFLENNLAIVWLNESSGSYRHEVTDIIKSDDTITVHILHFLPNSVGTDDMASWQILIEMSKTDWSGEEIIATLTEKE